MRRRLSHRRFPIVLTILTVFLSGAAIALAQEEEEDDTPVVEEEILVTALKGDAVSLQEIPLSVSAFAGEELTERGATSLTDFLQESPGVSLLESFGGVLAIEIRGVTSGLGDPLVGYYVDETPYSLLVGTWYPDIGTFDLDRVEVLRGPQGTLYGAGATAGVIRLITAPATTSGNDFHGEAALSSTDEGGENSRIQAAVNLAASDKFAFRLVGSSEDETGWIDNITRNEEDINDSETLNYRGKILFQPRSNLAITLNGTFADVEDDAYALTTREYTTNVSIQEPVDIENTFLSGVVNWVGKKFEIVSATSDVTSDVFLGAEFVGTLLESFIETDSLIQEVRFNTVTGGNWTWKGGALFRDVEQFLLQDASAVFGPLGIAGEIDESQSFALFTEVTRVFGDGKWNATVGARYWDDERTTIDFTLAMQPTQVQEFDAISPRFNIAYTPNSDTTAYFNAAKGFRSGQNQFPVSLLFASLLGVELPPGAREENLWAYELGLKKRFNGGKVLLDLATYYNDWTDLIVNAPVIQNQLNSLFNAGEAQMQGFEFGVQVRPNNTVRFGLNGNIADAEYGSDVTVMSVNPATGVPEPIEILRDGDRINGVPDGTFNGFLELQRAFGTRRGYISLNAQHTGERTANSIGTLLVTDDVLRVDMRVGLDSEKWGVSLFGENLTGEDGLVATSQTPGRPGLTFRPRTIGVSVRFNP